MKRINIIDKIGKKYLTSNIENDEFSYQKALKEIGKDISTLQKILLKESIKTSIFALKIKAYQF